MVFPCMAHVCFVSVPQLPMSPIPVPHQPPPHSHPNQSLPSHPLAPLQCIAPVSFPSVLLTHNVPHQPINKQHLSFFTPPPPFPNASSYIVCLCSVVPISPTYSQHPSSIHQQTTPPLLPPPPPPRPFPNLPTTNPPTFTLTLNLSFWEKACVTFLPYICLIRPIVLLNDKITFKLTWSIHPAYPPSVLNPSSSPKFVSLARSPSIPPHTCLDASIRIYTLAPTHTQTTILLTSLPHTHSHSPAYERSRTGLPQRYSIHTLNILEMHELCIPDQI